MSEKKTLKNSAIHFLNSFNKNEIDLEKTDTNI